VSIYPDINDIKARWPASDESLLDFAIREASEHAARVCAVLAYDAMEGNDGEWARDAILAQIASRTGEQQ